jgi:hypothetical protein
MFTVVLTDENNYEVAIPDRVTLVTEWFDASEIGGPKDCDIKVTGPDASYWQLKEWIGYKVTILNRNHDPVWWGLIESVLLNIGSGQVGWSLKDVRNKISVAYTDEKAGESIRGTTAWAEDTESIRRYGLRQHVESHSGLNAVTAVTKRDKLLHDLSFVYGQLTLGRSSDIGATLRCVGIYTTLESIYYTNLSGLEEYQGDQAKQQALGQGFAATTIGFTADGYIHDLTGRLHNFQKDHKIRVSGSTSNNNSFLIASETSVEAKSIVETTIGFSSPNGIYDNAQNLSFISGNDFLTITGAANSNNNGTKRAINAGSGGFQLAPSVNVTAGTGASITVSRGNKIQTSVALVEEFPGASITLTGHGQNIAQTFSLAANTSWTLSQITFRIKKIGNPTDNILVQLRNTTSGGLPNTTLETTIILNTDIGKDSSLVTATFLNTLVLTYGTLYAIVLVRSGSNDIADYYEVEVSENNSYPRGFLYLWDGAAWQAPYIASKLNFSVIGQQETTKQIEALVNGITASSISSYLVGVDATELSGRYSEQYQNGDKRAKDILSDLLSLGSVNSPYNSLTALITKDKLLRISPILAPNPGQNLQWTSSKTIIDASGKLLPHGYLPVGEWIEVEELPESIAAATGLSPFHCGYARYDCNSGEYEIRPSEQADMFI